MANVQMFDPTQDAVQHLTDLRLYPDVAGFLVDGVLASGESVTFEYETWDGWEALKNDGVIQQLNSATNNLATPVNARLRVNKTATTTDVSVLIVIRGR